MKRSSPKEILSKIYGYSEFRGNQEKIIQSVMNGEDCVVIQPTGSGKSLCYQIPAICMDGLAIVISPLISLMQNQVMGQKHFGIKAEFINSSLSGEDYEKIVENIHDTKLLYISPEKFVSETFQEWLFGLNISFFAIDEAHCVSRWGHDFRPDYMRLSVIKEKFKKPVIALTATADLKTRDDIPVQLGFEKYKLFLSGFDRPNIKILVEEKDNAKSQLMNLLNSYKDKSGIIYCLSRKGVEETASFLKKQGFDAVPYHAGMTSALRKKNQDYFLLKEGVIVVATIAFGMGIDKPDVRFVVHLDIPQNIESYYQEIGRAGRDGEPSIALLLYGMRDYASRSSMIHRSGSSQKMVELGKLNEMLAFAETLSCKRNYLMTYFGDEHVPCGNCESCLNPGEKIDVSDLAKRIITTIKLTKQLYGMTYISLLLKGSDGSKVRDEHKKLSIYGSCLDESDLVIKKTIRQLIVGQYLKIDLNSGFNNLIAIKDVDQKIYIRKEVVKITVEKSQYDEVGDLYSQLKELRFKIAAENNIPPYIVLHDKSLKEMVKKKPKTIKGLKRIHGWGEKRIEKYGDIFLNLLKSHK